MYRKYFFKRFTRLIGSSILVTAITTTAVACHHKTISPPKNKNTWTNFKTAALKISADALKSNIKNISKYYWNNDDVAIFDSAGKPSANESAKSIMATIIVEGAATSDYQFPIQCNITYVTNKPYAINDWTYSQSANVRNWFNFKAIALTVTPNELLSQAEEKNNWNTWVWEGGLKTNKWPLRATAEFDIFGSLNSKDPYKGMQGKPTANDKTDTISAIISIKDQTKEGNYDANPISATITFRNNKGYDVADWKLKPIRQQQSHLKYLNLLNQQITSSKRIKYPDNGGWGWFASNNWIDSKRSQTVGNYLDANNPGLIYHVRQNAVPNGNSLTIIIFAYNINQDTSYKPHTEIDLTATFVSAFGDPNSGNCFNQSWNINTTIVNN